MFYCRVLLGEHEAIVGRIPAGQGQKRRPSDRPAHRATHGGTPYDSIIADRRSTHATGAQQLHREFIAGCPVAVAVSVLSVCADPRYDADGDLLVTQVFDNARTYPEFLITYKLT